MVYTESAAEHTVAVWLNDGKEYERPTKRVTCSACNGSGKQIVTDMEKSRSHDYVYVGHTGNTEHQKCKYCGERWDYHHTN